jgi:pimeloyl-ACP methyl ester carboxylesterase
MGIPLPDALASGEAARLRWEWALGASGAGSVVTCVPGLFAGGWIWDNTWSRLRSEGLSALRLRDPLAAFGPARDPVAHSRRVLETLLDGLGVTGSIICGNSLGALLALDLARLRPRDVRAIVLSGAPGLDDGVNLGIGTPRAATREFVSRLVDVLFCDRSGVTEDMIERTRAVFTDKGRLRNVVRALRAARRYPARDALAAIACPVLMIWGANDVVTPPAEWARCAAGMSNGEFHVIPDCGHVPMLERPAEFNRLLLDFVRRVFAEPAADRRPSAPSR